MGLKDYVESNEDIFFLMYNSFNDLLGDLKTSSSLYVTELLDRSLNSDEISLILFILSILVLVIVVVALIPVVASVNRQKDKVLSLFCEIEDSRIRKMSGRCEKFIGKI